MNEERFEFFATFIICCVFIMLMAIVSIYAWIQIPAGEEIPVHWGINGEPDRYGSKAEGFLLIPGLSIFLLILFAVLPKIEPRRLHLAKSQKAYKAVIISIFALLLGVHLFVALSALGMELDVQRIIPILVGLLFIVIGNYLGKVRSNFFMGIRTPWTLSSEKSWNKTHRLGGKLFALLGFLTIISAIFTPNYTFVILIGGVIIKLIVTITYSYIIWRNDELKST